MFPKIGVKYPKMEGENIMEKPMNEWMIWVVSLLFLECHPYMVKVGFVIVLPSLSH